jgi:hypothetical protein
VIKQTNTDIEHVLPHLTTPDSSKLESLPNTAILLHFKLILSNEKPKGKRNFSCGKGGTWNDKSNASIGKGVKPPTRQPKKWKR